MMWCDPSKRLGQGGRGMATHKLAVDWKRYFDYDVHKLNYFWFSSSKLDTEITFFLNDLVKETVRMDPPLLGEGEPANVSCHTVTTSRWRPTWSSTVWGWRVSTPALPGLMRRTLTLREWIELRWCPSVLGGGSGHWHSPHQSNHLMDACNME